MVDSEKLSMVKALLELDISDASEDERISVYLTAAEKEILSWRYSYASKIPDELPVEYEMTQIFAVVAGYSQAGAENQKSHVEGTISRTFAYSDMLHYIRANVIPIVRCI